MTRLIDLSHALVSGEATYPGLPAPEIGDFRSHAASASQYSSSTVFHIARITMVANSGTYVDAPYHRYPEGADVAGLALERLANLPAVCVRTSTGRVDTDTFASLDVAGKAVLVHTGWARNWGSASYMSGHPYLTAGAATWLIENGAVHVGIDSLNIDDTSDGNRPVHTRLLAAGIPITEHLTNLEQLPASGFRYFAVPVKVRGAGSFPARAFALVP